MTPLTPKKIIKKYIISIPVCLLLLIISPIAPAAAAEPPIVIEGINEWPSPNPADKLVMAEGVTTTTIFRSDRERPELSDGRGWTWQHHPDLAAWRGRLYVAWDSGEKDEDRWPARQVYSTSADGSTWAKPKELFPQGTSTPTRMHFFHAPNGVMLTIAGLRSSREITTEKTKDGAIIRRINDDHALGPVHVLRWPGAWVADSSQRTEPCASLPFYTASRDKQFVEACTRLLASRTFLEQQDFGRFLDMEDRIIWEQNSAWSKNLYQDNDRAGFGRATSFFHRKDGAIVGISKQRWVTVSHDEGETWSQPVKPGTLVSGNAKVWGQRTADGRYALVYNPNRTKRYPLVVVTSDDGIHFKDMAVVNPGTDPRRYEGILKTYGAQYMRGISEWTSDGS